MQDAQITVTKLAQHPDGYWTARVSQNGSTLSVDDRHGSWQADVRVAPGARTFKRCEVRPAVAVVLQDRKRRAGGSVATRR